MSKLFPRSRAEAMRYATSRLSHEVRIRRALERTWQAIGYDMLSAAAEDMGRDIDGVNLPRDDVIEIVLDADYLELNGGLARNDPALLWFRALPKAQQDALARKVFPLRSYGT